jgi:site-specific DNA-methyltransferase (adenine-specific)
MKKAKENHTNRTMSEVAELFHVSSSTIHNWIKEGLLMLDEERHVTAESLREFQSQHAGKHKLHARANKLLKDEHDVAEVGRTIQAELRSDAFDDAIGTRYESMLSESYRNKEGITYTPKTIIDDMTRGLRVDETTWFLDPCCGSGNFLVHAIEMGVTPDHVFGFDTDPNAVAIARRRIKEMTGYDTQQVVCGDFLKEGHRLKQRFDVVFTNPPWGKKLSKKERTAYAKRYQAGSSADTSSLFLFSILSVLKPDGIVGLLMPESFFKIAVYEDARKAVLQKTILKIKDYGKAFLNMYSAVSILVKNTEPEANHQVVCSCNWNNHSRSQHSFMTMPRYNLNYWMKSNEVALLERLMQHPHLTLKGHASWGLGIVTGDNAKICKRSRRVGFKPVYRGQDILPGRLKAANLYINPDDFPRCQQLPPMWMFQATEKLVYRFISSELVFYCDTHQRYILNSANMLVLNEDFPLTSKQLAQIMNSPLTNWLFKRLFNTHKVLKSDLELLPVFTDLSLHRRFNLLDLDR